MPFDVYDWSSAASFIFYILCLTQDNVVFLHSVGRVSKNMRRQSGENKDSVKYISL